jgi:hypothetical protein
MNREHVLDTLSSPDLCNEISTAVKEWPGATADTVSRCVEQVRKEQNSFAAALREIDDDGEIATVLAINYIELKSRWIALNTKINYQTFRTGQCETVDALCASATSLLLQQIESLIDHRDIEKITEFLAQPVSQRD